MSDRRKMYESILKGNWSKEVDPILYEAILTAMDEAFFYGWNKGYNEGYQDAKPQKPDFNV